MQWEFVIAPPKKETVERLSTLSHEDIQFIAFVVGEDSTGNQIINGFVRTTRRVRVNILRNIIGPAIIANISSKNSYIILEEIQMNPTFFVSGDVESTVYEVVCKNIAELKQKINHHRDDLKKNHSAIIARHPNILLINPSIKVN